MIRVLSGLTTGLICSVCLLTTSLAYGQQYPGMSGANGYMNAGGYAPGQPYGGQPYGGQPYGGQPMAQPYGGQPYGGQPYGGQPGSRPGVTPAYMASPAQLMQGFGGEQVGPGSFRRQSGQRVASRFAPAARPGGPKSPRWFDIAVDAVWLKRDASGSGGGISSEGIAGPIVLSTDDGAFDTEIGMRFEATIPLNGGRVLEFSYMGLFDHSANETVTSNGNLFSVLSDFGTAPFGGFGETGQANEHSLSYRTGMDTVELGFRRRWTDPNSLWQGSWLAGVRHFYVTEDFSFGSQSNNGTLDYDSSTVNSMTGFQLGADVWLAAQNGLDIGLFGKVGVYGNRIKQDSSYLATSINPAVVSDQETERASFVLEAGAMANWRVNQNLTVRAGYQVLLLDGVALASDQFSNNPPFVQPLPASVVVDDGELIYTGFNFGVEWMW
ncbi:hypothetical protein OAI33_04805 [Pirellulaceae bacterium]|nr:hypothetical protein [Pirellulaceae bacterium]